MNYYLEAATNANIDILIKYKLNTILEYADNLTKEEKNKIINYVKINIPSQIKDYNLIKVNNKIIGCLLVHQYLDGVLLNEIFLEEQYRNQKIGTDIIKKVLFNNPTVYLWVYKKNIKAISLYKELGCKVIQSTDTRYFMKYTK